MQHVNGVHLKTLPYRCPICDMGWRKKSAMLAHMKEHAVKSGEGEGEGGASAEMGEGANGEEEGEENESLVNESMDESSIGAEGVDAPVNQTI